MLQLVLNAVAATAAPVPIRTRESRPNLPAAVPTGMPHYECSVRSVLDEVHSSGAILLRPEIRLLQSGCATMPGRVCPIPARRVQIY